MTNVFQFTQPGAFVDPPSEVLRNGARTLLAQAVEAEIAALLAVVPTSCPRMAANGWCVTAICPSVRS
jgi:hypothetical protein